MVTSTSTTMMAALGTLTRRRNAVRPNAARIDVEGISLGRLVKWLIGVTVTSAVFMACLWFGWVVGIKIWPDALRADADRWVVAASFATVVAGAVFGWIAWWAGRDTNPKTDGENARTPLSFQTVQAREGGAAYGVQHGDQHVYHHFAPNTENDAAIAPEADTDK